MSMNNETSSTNEVIHKNCSALQRDEIRAPYMQNKYPIPTTSGSTCRQTTLNSQHRHKTNAVTTTVLSITTDLSEQRTKAAYG